MQPIHAFVAAFEPSGPAQVGMNDDAAHVVAGQDLRMALDPHVSKSLRAHPRLENVVLRSRRDDLIDLQRPDALRHFRCLRQGQFFGVRGRVDVVGGDVTVLIERLAVGQSQPRPSGPRSVSLSQPAMFRPRSMICRLASRALDIGGRDLIDAPNRRRRRSAQACRDRGRQRERETTATAFVDVTVSSSVSLKSIRHALHQVGRQDGASPGHPIVARCDDLPSTHHQTPVPVARGTPPGRHID